MNFQQDDDVALAHRLADAADTISARHFQQSPATARKSDGTVVSAADLAVEVALLEILRVHRPDDGVVSEESGTVVAGAHRQWILDPIDGTEPFLAGQRSWGTHIALTVDGELDVAMITRPTERRRWWAARGRGAWSAPVGQPEHLLTSLAVSHVDVLSDARIGGFVAPGSELATAIARHGHWVADSLGDIVALIEGRVDVVIAPAGEIWDHAPQVLLTTEAGGRYTDKFKGTSVDARGGIYTNGLLTEQVWAVPDLCRLD
ncbi:inositol monophosphatase family protein [Brachybacterium sp. GCM10030268]|uniref:inositol monophosphatase family protein n=1 Tax=Brachybacterium sp. GCM10030268 TaxID=3273382 RepID=UPI003616F1F6